MASGIRVLVLMAGVVHGMLCPQGFGDRPSHRPQLTAYRCEEAPTIDGDLSDAAWKRAGKAPFVAPPDSLQNVVYTCYDDQAVYVAVTCQEPHIDTAKFQVAKPDTRIWIDESVRIELLPKDTLENSYSLVINLSNSRADGRTDDLGILDRTWNGKWTSAVKKSKDGWAVEIAVPFAVLDQESPAQGTNWGINVSRYRSNKNIAYPDSYCWSPNEDYYFADLRDRCGRLRFESQASVAVESLGDFFPGEQTMAFDLTGQAAEARLYATRDRRLHTLLATTLRPGRHRLTWRQTFADEKIAAEIRLPSGELLYASGWIPVNQQVRETLVPWLERVDESGEIMADFQKLIRAIEAMDGAFAARNAHWQKHLTAIIDRAKEKQHRRILANGPKDANGRPVYGIATASSMSKILPHRPELARLDFKANIELMAARNEMEAGQVIVYSPDKDLKQVTLSASALTSDTGETIPQSAVTAAVVGFVKTSKPLYQVDHVGWWPDPIMTNLDTFDIRKGDLQSIWYAVRVPGKQRPGLYKGTLTIKPGNAAAVEIPVRLKVWDFALPERPSLPTSVAVNTNAVYGSEQHDKARMKRLNEAFDRFVMEHRTNPGQLYRSSPPDEETLIRWNGLGATDFNILAIRRADVDNATMTLRPEKAKQVRERIRQTLQIVEKNRITARPYVYVFDEAGPEFFPALENITAWLNKEFPGLYTLTTTFDASCGTRSGIKSVKAFCPLTPVYNLHTAGLSRQQGHDVWWYVCCGPRRPFANVLLESPALDTRLLMGVMPYAYGADGFLYYSMTRPKNNNDKRLVDGPYTNWNPNSYTDRKGKYNGDGLLIYPGQDGPISSIRMENWLDGLEDYEYLKLLEDQINRLGRQGKTERAAQLRAGLRRFACPGSEILNDLADFTGNPGRIEEMRRVLAERILQGAGK